MTIFLNGSFQNINNESPCSGYMVPTIIDMKTMEDLGDVQEFFVTDEFNPLMELDTDLYMGFINDESAGGLFRHHHNLIGAVKMAHEMACDKVYDLELDRFLELRLDSVEEDCNRQLI